MASNQFYGNMPDMPSRGAGNPSGGNYAMPARPIMQQGQGGEMFSGASPTAYPSGYSPLPSGGGNPYQVPGTGPLNFPGDTANTNYTGSSHQARTANPGSENLGHGIIATGLQYPGLSQDFANYLMSQVGAGMTPYNMSTMLPTGGQTQPGQLTAGLNPLAQQLMQFFQTGQGGLPGMQSLNQIATQGVNAVPAWQQMLDAQQRNISQNQANLKEQFGGMGNLAGSPFANAMTDYATQTTKDQNALLGQLQLQGILQGQMPAAEALMGAGATAASGFQGLDQQAIQNQLQEFQRVSPQNNPMLPYIQGLSTLFPPTTKTATTWENINSTLGALSGAGFSSSTGAGGASSTGITL